MELPHLGFKESKRLELQAEILTQVSGTKTMWRSGGRVAFWGLGAALLLMLCLPCQWLAAPAGGPQSGQVQWPSKIKKALAGPDVPPQVLSFILEDRWDEADSELNLLASSHPGDPELVTLSGVLLLLEGHLPQAQQAFERALAIAPAFDIARRNLAITHWHEHHNVEATSLLRLFHDKNPDDALANLYLGQAEFSEHDCSPAVKAFHQAGELLPSSPSAMFMNVVCDVQLGNVDEAEGLLKRMGPHPRLPPPSVFSFAIQAEKSGLHQVAFLTLQLLPTDFPDPYTRAYDTALAAYETHDCVTAAKILRHLSETGQSTPVSWDLLGNVLQDQGVNEKKPLFVQEAYNAYRQGIYQDPHYLGNFLDIALLALKLANYDLAGQLLTQGIRQNPQAFQLFIARGTAQAFGGHEDVASADYQRAMELAPDDPLPPAFQGLLDIQGGRYLQAAATLEAGIKRSKQPNAWLCYLLAKARYQSGEMTSENQARIREALKEAIRLDPNLADAYGLAGLMWLKSGEYQQAAEFFEKAHQLDPGNSRYVFELAKATKQKGDPASAAKYLETFQQLEAASKPTMHAYFMRMLVTQQASPALQETASSNLQ